MLLVVTADNQAIKDRISEMAGEMIPQARAEAWKVFQRAPHALELDELEATALWGLSQAAAKFMAYNQEHGYALDDFRYFHAYCMRRMRGAMLDSMRSQDWVTRSARTRAKKLRDAGQDQGLGEAELARAAGLTVAEVRDTLAVVAARPVSFDAEPYDVEGTDDVEGQVVVTSVLAAATAVIRALGGKSRLILVLRYYHNLTIPDTAAVLGVEENEAARLHAEAVLAVHQSMLRAVV